MSTQWNFTCWSEPAQTKTRTWTKIVPSSYAFSYQNYALPEVYMYGKSPGLSGSLLDIAQISWSTLTSELFCALVWNLAHLFPPKIQNILWFKVIFWDIFALVSSVIEVMFPTQILMVCSLCKTSYNIISHTHAITCGIGQFVRLLQSRQSILKRAYAPKYPWLF